MNFLAFLEIRSNCAEWCSASQLSVGKSFISSCESLESWVNLKGAVVLGKYSLPHCKWITWAAASENRSRSSFYKSDCGSNCSNTFDFTLYFERVSHLWLHKSE